MYKKAEYKEIDIKGHTFLFLTSENAIFEIEPKIKEILDLFDSSGEFNKKEISKRIEDEEITDSLINRRVFVPAEVDSRNTQAVCADIL